MVDKVLGESVPDPAEVRDLAGLIEALNLLRAASGNPSFRVLARSAGSKLRPPQVLAHTTLRDLFQQSRRRLDINLLTATVRALGLSEPEVVRWRQACVRVHVEAKSGGSPGVLRQLPAESAVFTGRERELDAVMKTALERTDRDSTGVAAVSVIVGMGGVGKTQLALRAAHELVRSGRFAEVQLYVDLRGFDPERPPADPADVLAAFLRQLGVPDQQVPGPLDERAAMFRDRTHGRDAVVVLDNAADARQLQHLMPAASTCFVLVTSRRTLADLEGATHLVLDVFQPEEALALLAKVVSAARAGAEPEAADQIVRACGRLPLAVSIAAARLKSRPAWPLAELAGRLRAGPRAIVSAERSLETVFDLSYRALAPLTGRMFRALGRHPGDDFTAWSTAALAGIGAERAELLLEELLDENFLSQNSPGRYSLHDLLRQYARHLGSTCAADDDPAAARRRLLDYYVHAAHQAAVIQVPDRDRIVVPLTTPPPELPPMPDAAAAGDWFDAEFAALCELVDDCLEPEPVVSWQLAWSAVGHCMKTARTAELAELQTVALRAADVLDNTSARIYSLQTRALANGNNAGCDPRDVVADLERSVELCRTIGDRFYEARGLSNLSAITSSLGERVTALEYAEMALAASRALGAAGLVEQARNLNLIGFSHAKHGDVDRAIPACREAVRLAEECLNPWVQGVALDSLAYAYRRAGDFDESAASYRRAVAVHHENGAVLFQARTLTHLAELHELTGDTESALAALAEALPIFDTADRQLAQDTRKRIAEIKAGS